MPLYLRPTDLDEALRARAEQHLLPLAGGTDVYPARVGRPLDEDVLDLGAIDELRGIAAGADGWRIGACVTWAELVQAGLPPVFDGLRAAAGAIGGLQIQNTGTIGGNLCTASPAADGIPNLMALDAKVELASTVGRRMVPIARFLTGARVTALAPDELLVAVHVPRPEAATRGLFVKLGARRDLVISIVMLAIVIELEGELIAAARVAVGACSPVAVRLPRLERRLIGETPSAELAELVDRTALEPLRPIDDIRASAAYRLDATLTLLRRALASLARDNTAAIA